ncbi:hypothetical protein AB0D11_03235 [Streptomyces monashensis]|uniref:effector-associated constant component EACC1 n=1 Tax=Streptomyces monashensis TaxID=1678012 RepID=UPI0033F6EDAB
MGASQTWTGIELRSDVEDDLDALYRELRGTPGLRAQFVAAAGVAGEQGSALDMVTVACTGGALTVLLQIIKAVVESRRPRMTVKVRRGDVRLEVTADNVDQVLPLIESLFSDES